MTIFLIAQPPKRRSCSQLSCKCVIVANYKMHVFEEVLMRPCMLLMFQHPRRSQYAPMNDSHLFHYHVFRAKMKIVYPSDFTPHIQRLNFSWRRTFVLHSWCHPKEILTLAWDNLRQKFEISTIYVPIPQSYPHFDRKNGALMTPKFKNLKLCIQALALYYCWNIMQQGRFLRIFWAFFGV